MPLLGQVNHADGDASPRVPRSNSAQRLRELQDVSRCRPSAAALAATPGPVLLVDDFTKSGWTLTVVARPLRQPGVTGVFPLVLAPTELIGCQKTHWVGSKRRKGRYQVESTN